MGSIRIAVALGFLCLAPLRPAQQGSDARPVVTILPQRSDLERWVSVPGASIAPLQQATLMARVSGYLEAIDVEEGDVLERGDRVARIHVPELEAELALAEARFAEAEAGVEEALAGEAVAEAALHEKHAAVRAIEAEAGWRRTVAERSRKLYEKRAAKAEDVEQAEAEATMADARIEMARTEVRSYEARLRASRGLIESRRARVVSAQAERGRARALIGFAELSCPYGKATLTRRFVDTGVLIRKDETPVATLMDLERVRVQVEVAERDAAWVRSGARMVLEVGDFQVEGAIARTAGAIDPSTRTLRAEAELDNSGRALVPGMYGRMRILVERRAGALTLPAEALLVEGAKRLVWVVRDGRARKVAVEIGLDDGVRVEVRAGLQAGEQVILGAPRSLAEGEAVRPRPREPEAGA